MMRSLSVELILISKREATLADDCDVTPLNKFMSIVDQRPESDSGIRMSYSDLLQTSKLSYWLMEAVRGIDYYESRDQLNKS